MMPIPVPNNIAQLLSFHTPVADATAELDTHRRYVLDYLRQRFPTVLEISPDLHWMNPENEALSIENVRTLTADTALKPYQAPNSIFVILSIDRASLPAQQALLKLLEEPPAHVQFILTTTNLNRVLETIQSRCAIERLSTSPTDQQPDPQITQVLSAIQTGTYSQLFALSEEYKEKASALGLLESLLITSHTKNSFQPTREQIRILQTLRKSIALIEQNVNVRLVLEECFFSMQKIK